MDLDGNGNGDEYGDGNGAVCECTRRGTAGQSLSVPAIANGECRLANGQCRLSDGVCGHAVTYNRSVHVRDVDEDVDVDGKGDTNGLEVRMSGSAGDGEPRRSWSVPAIANGK